MISWLFGGVLLASPKIGRIRRQKADRISQVIQQIN
jgi:hypothetical protein